MKINFPSDYHDFTSNKLSKKINFTIIVILIIFITTLGATTAEKVKPEQNDFNLNYMRITKSELTPGESVNISVEATNTHNKKKTDRLVLEISDIALSKDVTLEPKQSKRVSFEYTAKRPGEKLASISGLYKSFTVKKPTTYNKPPLDIKMPEWRLQGEKAKIFITSNGEPVENAEVGYRYKPFFSEGWSNKKIIAMTNENGRVKLSFDKPGDYEIFAAKDGHRGKSEILFEDKKTTKANWYINSASMKGKYTEFFDNAFHEYLRINTFPQGIKKLFLRPRVIAKDDSFNLWDDFTLKFRFKILRLDGGFMVNIRRNTRGHYSVSLDTGTSPFGFSKTYPKRDYEHENNQKNLARGDYYTKPAANVKKVGVWHKVKITAIEDTIRVELDGELVLKAEDNSSKGLKKSFNSGVFEFGTHENIDILLDGLVLKEVLKDYSETTEVLRVYPEGNSKIAIRGAKDKNVYNNIRFTDARTIGANWVVRNHTFWIDSDDFTIDPHELGLIGCQEFLPIKDYIKKAHYRGLKVFYFPRIEWEGGIISGKGGIPPHAREKFIESATETAVEAAKFAEKNDVEMFAPITNLHGYVQPEVARKYYEEVFPLVREVYKGKIVKGKNPLRNNPEQYDYSKFDYITINPGSGDNYEQFRNSLSKAMKVGLNISKKYDNKGIILHNPMPLPIESFFKKQLKKRGSVEKVIGKYFDIFFSEIMGKATGTFISYKWSEKPSAGLYMKEPLTGKQIHGKSWFKGYIGPDISTYVKKYYSSSYESK